MQAKLFGGVGTALIAILIGATSAADATSKRTAAAEPTVIGSATPLESVAVRDLGASAGFTGQAPARINPLAGAPGRGDRGTSAAPSPPDPLAGEPSADGRTPAPNLVFDGISNPFSCGGCLPPDTIGDAGPNHYIQMTNATKVAIYNKSGVLQTPMFDLSELWPAGEDCNLDNRGDPVVVYDGLADRWLLSQFQDSPGNRLCFAISQTADPLGDYHLYEFTPPEFPDYFKVGVWPTGYYVSSNESSYAAYAFDRAKMLTGAAATFVRFDGETNFLLPADVDGPTPPASQGGLFYTFKDDSFHGGADRLELFRLTPDFAVPADSTFEMIESIPITPYTYTVCGFFIFSCIPQPGTSEGLDPVSEWPMWRFAYRNTPDGEVLLGNFTVDAGSDRAGIRWFELRNTGSGYDLFQEGTHAPAGLHRFMGSIAMDGDGNIALGYSTSSSTEFPSIKYATRCAADPLGTLQAEQTMKAGAGSQTSTANRWGDYSAMSIDPADDQSFWYTNEYYSSTSTSNWKTSIGRFDIPAGDCGPPILRTLSVSTAGSGSGTVTGPGINCPGDCTETYPNNTAVSLSATPDAGSDFAGFSGDCSGSTCDLTMNADRAVTATFVPEPPPSRTLNVTKLGAGSGSITGPGINCPGDCTETYPNNTAVSLSATALAGSSFAGFAGDCTGNACNLTMNADRAVSGTFNANPTPIPVPTDFSFGKLKRNTRNGTAKLEVTVPDPGSLILGGKGIKPQRQLARAKGEKPVAAGTTTLKIKPTGAKKKKLKRTGKVKVTAKVTYTPNGGTPATQTKKIKLKRKRRR